jgi:LysR family transcriptional regulator for metE and metH
MKNIDLQHLRLIKHIVDEGSMSNATQKMFLTQSALSHMLRELENSLGIKVFLRRSKKLHLTDAGEAILQHGEKILYEFAELENTLAFIKSEKKEIIRISTTCYTSYHWLPSIIKMFKNQNPFISINIVTEATHKTLSYLEKGKLDIAITDTKPVLPAIYKIDFLFEDEFVLIASKNSRFARMEQLEPRDFDGADLFIFDMDERNSTLLNHFIRPNNIRLNSLAKLQLTEGIIEMVAADLGITVMPTWIALPYLDQHEIIAVKLPGKPLKRKWYAVSHKKASKPQRELIGLLQNQLRNKRSL